jgi:hypothetical protein
MTPTGPNAHVVSPAASPEETAAIAAALETFMRATAPAAAGDAQAPDPWQRAAILEGVSGEPEHDLLHPWINT